MTQEHFVKTHSSFWAQMERLSRGKKKDLRESAAEFPAMCRRLTADLNTARSCGMDSQLVERLNRLVLDSWRLLHVPRPLSLPAVARFIVYTLPRSVRREWKSFMVAQLLFWGTAILFAFLVVRWPDLAGEFVGQAQLHSVEEMYNPASEYYLVPRSVTNDADMFGYYIYNNISIAFRTFAGGILAGIGSLFFLLYNALFLGVISGHILNEGFSSTFFPFVIAHSSLELTAIVMSAQAGLQCGWSIFARRGLSVRSSLRRATKRALPLVAGAALMLVAAAAIEAFWSSRHELPVLLRYGSGALSWLALVLWFALGGRRIRA